MAGNGAVVHEVSSLGANQDVRIREAYREAAQQGGEITTDYARHVAASGGLGEHDVLGLVASIPEGGKAKEVDFDVYKVPMNGTNHPDKIRTAHESAAKRGGRIIAEHSLAVATRGGVLGHGVIYLVGEFESRKRSKVLRSSSQYS